MIEFVSKKRTSLHIDEAININICVGKLSICRSIKFVAANRSGSANILGTLQIGKL